MATVGYAEYGGALSGKEQPIYHSARFLILPVARIWALEVAFTYAQMKVVGIDPNRTLTRYAQVQARTQGLENVDFQVMDALHDLDFPDHTYI